MEVTDLKLFRTFAAIGAVTAAVLATTAVPAAAQPQDFPFRVYSDYNDQWSDGVVHWNNRTVTVVSARISDIRLDEPTYQNRALVQYQVFASSSTPVDSYTTTVNDALKNIDPDPELGDPNLRGGVVRIKITVCNDALRSRTCGTPLNVSRPIGVKK